MEKTLHMTKREQENVSVTKEIVLTMQNILFSYIQTHIQTS